MKTILFVCTHNAGRSQMAEALLNRRAAARGIAARAISAGTVGGGELNPTVVAALAELGVDVSGARPKRLEQGMADEADLVVSMGCGVDPAACPARFLATEDWGLVDPAGRPIQQVRAIRDEIAARVERLLDGVERCP